jgi:putative ABC transport system permease protein
MSTLLAEIRLAVRNLLRTPSLTCAALLTLTIGVGANTAVFSVVDGVLLRPLPYAEPERLVAIRSNQSLPELTDIRNESTALAAIAGVVRQPLDLTGGSEPLQVDAGLVTGDLFDLFGVTPRLGRTLVAEDDRIGGDRVVVLGHGLWQRELGADPNVLGRAVELSGRSYTVVGVLPAGFKLPQDDVELYVPLQVANPVAAPHRGVHFLRTYARLAPGATVESAQAELDAINARMQERFPDESGNRTTSPNQRYVALHERLTGDTRPTLTVLFAAVGLVLLVACANFANILLTRGAERRHEIAIRAALGASRWRLVRLLVVESLMLALAGGALGALVAVWGVERLVALEPGSLPHIASIEVDGRVLAFAIAISIATGLVFGLLPALKAVSIDVNRALKDADGRVQAARSGLRGALVVVEVALALVLVVGAGLLVRSFSQLLSVDAGFAIDDKMTMRIELPEARYESIAAQTRFRLQLLDSLTSRPGVEAAMVSELPMSGSSLDHDFVVEGWAAMAPGSEPSLLSRSVAGDYFGVMGIPAREGRLLTPTDDENAPLVGVVNEAFARTYFPEGSPVGARIRWARMEGEPQWIEIVGVAGDVKHFGLTAPERPAIYTPYVQSPQAWKRWMWLVVGGAPDARSAITAVKNDIAAIDPLIPITRQRTMREVAAESLAERRFVLWLFGLFGVVASMLAAAGIYSVVAYSVARRTREMGIRRAVGARAGDVVGLVLKQGLRLAATGAIIGTAAALALSQFIASLLFGVSATDPATYVAMALVLIGIAALACLVPAIRAARVDPASALRHE